MTTMHCSFCGALISKVPSAPEGCCLQAMLPGKNATICICRECIATCAYAAAQHDPEWREQQINSLIALRGGPPKRD
jgi:hypothetical protein